MKRHFHTFTIRTLVFIFAAGALAVQGIWGADIAHHWFFWIITGLIIVLACLQAATTDHKWLEGDQISHYSIAMLLFVALISYPFNESGQAIINSDAPVRLAYTKEGKPMALPFELQLQRFDITYYNDNQHVKQFTTTLEIKDLLSSNTTTKTLVTSVNHPARYNGYIFYQDSYDLDSKAYSVIKIVKSPFLPLVYIAMLIMAFGAVLQIRKHWIEQQNWVWIITGALFVVFTIISIARIRFGILMPALRSLWFVPHLACYMIAYAMLAIAIVLSIVGFKPSELSTNLLHTSSALLLLGMLCGAMWAQQAWGDYWAWDPKECWAAATWLFSLAATHTHRTNDERKVLRIVFMILCFIAMQITWYGVNSLPSAEQSMHTYNVKK